MCRGVEAFVATSEKNVVDAVSCARPTSQCCAAKKFWIIGMSEDDQYVLRSGPTVRCHGSGNWESGDWLVRILIPVCLRFAAGTSIVFVTVAGGFGFSAQGFQFVPRLNIFASEGFS